jgi:hypothetical protein
MIKSLILSAGVRERIRIRHCHNHEKLILNTEIHLCQPKKKEDILMSY